MVAALAPKVLDGTRCDTHTLDMCINGKCMVGINIKWALNPFKPSVLLWDIVKQYKPRSDAAERGV